MAFRSWLALAALTVSGLLALVSLPGAPGARSAAAPTYWADVRPLLAEHCVTCHSPGGIAPFALDTPQAAARAARAAAAAVGSGLMPPWKPGPDSPAFLNDHRLSERQKGVIAAWAAAGAPLGDEKFATPLAAAAARAQPDAVFSLPVTFTPPSGVDDEYRCFLIDPGLKQDRFVTRFNVRPGQPSEVHHVIVYQVKPAARAEALALEGKDGRPGWQCFGGSGLSGSLGWLGAWAPGGNAVDFPSGHGPLLQAGNLLVLQVHYNLTNGAKPDRTSVELGYAPVGAKLTPLKTGLVVAPVELPCPPGAKGALCNRDAALAELVKAHGPRDAAVANGLLGYCGKTLADYALKPGSDATRLTTDCSLPAPGGGGTIFGVAGHMHLRGVSIRLELLSPAGPARTLLDIPDWDFHWQGQYWLRQPVKVGPGDRVKVTCTFNNAASAQPVVNGQPQDPRYVLWGEGTRDEMCLGIVTYSPG
ncbi:MAG TPA: hypothetical protein VHN99_07850 [Deinococcales bacterium]|nr:hypothetical protein [Deinococcales bacterium]